MTAYVQVISLVERLHRQFLEVVKLEIEGLGIHDINNVQGIMLFNIGDAEMTVGELAPARLLPRLERLLQRQEDRQERVSYAAALAARPPLDPGQSDPKRAQIAGQADNDASEVAPVS